MLVAADPHIDRLRSKMTVVEDPRYTREYLEADKRSIANAVQVFFKDGSSTAKVEVEYPLGHRRRRVEGIPLLIQKFRADVATRFSGAQAGTRSRICCWIRARLEATPVPVLMDMLAQRRTGVPPVWRRRDAYATWGMWSRSAGFGVPHPAA